MARTTRTVAVGPTRINGVCKSRQHEQRTRSGRIGRIRRPVGPVNFNNKSYLHTVVEQVGNGTTDHDIVEKKQKCCCLFRKRPGMRRMHAALH